MGRDGRLDEETQYTGERAVEVTLEQLRALQYGVAATIMPVSDGWRVHYFSIPDFDSEPGTTFASYEEAMDAIDEVVPAVNSPEDRARARDEVHERLRHQPEQPG